MTATKPLSGSSSTPKCRWLFQHRCPIRCRFQRGSIEAAHITDGSAPFTSVTVSRLAGHIRRSRNPKGVGGPSPLLRTRCRLDYSCPQSPGAGTVNPQLTGYRPYLMSDDSRIRPVHGHRRRVAYNGHFECVSSWPQPAPRFVKEPYARSRPLSWSCSV